MHPFEVSNWFNNIIAFDNIDWQVAKDKYGMHLFSEQPKRPHYGDTFVEDGEMYTYYCKRFKTLDTGMERGWYIVTDVTFDEFNFPNFKFEKTNRAVRKISK